MMHLLLLERITLSNATQPATAALLSGKVNTVATVNTRRLASSLRVFYIAFHDKVIFVNVFHGKVFRCFKSLAISHPYGRQQICYLRNVRRSLVCSYVLRTPSGNRWWWLWCRSREEKTHARLFRFFAITSRTERNTNKSFRGHIFFRCCRSLAISHQFDNKSVIWMRRHKNSLLSLAKKKMLVWAKILLFFQQQKSFNWYLKKPVKH